MNLTRCEIDQAGLSQHYAQFSIATLGNEFSDQKTAAETITGLLKYGWAASIVCITVRDVNGQALCCYIAAL
jgi:hypothetical protein